MSITAVVPVKPLGAALGRLGRALDAAERRALQQAMLRDVLEACDGARSLAQVLVVTADPEAMVIAREMGADVLDDHDPPAGMNAAVELGLARCTALGARAALVVTADLPCACPEDLDALVDGLPGTTGVALSPSLDGTGTNAMLLAPARALRPQLGIGSLSRHLAQAAERDLSVRVIHRPGLALDVDTPEDLALLCRGEGSSRARAVCVRLGLADRAAAVGAR